MSPMKAMIQISWLAFADINIALPIDPAPIKIPYNDCKVITVVKVAWDKVVYEISIDEFVFEQFEGVASFPLSQV